VEDINEDEDHQHDLSNVSFKVEEAMNIIRDRKEWRCTRG